MARGPGAGAARCLGLVESAELIDSARAMPGQALAKATRGVVRVGETVEIMLKRIIELYESADADKIKALAALDDRVDRKHAAIKLCHLGELMLDPYKKRESWRS